MILHIMEKMDAAKPGFTGNAVLYSLMKVPALEVPVKVELR